jgi:hypothetical protein
MKPRRATPTNTVDTEITIERDDQVVTENRRAKSIREIEERTENTEILQYSVFFSLDVLS